MSLDQIARDIREGTFPNKSETTLREEAASLMWQPIETAPKDGSKILAYAPKDADGRPRYAVTWWRQQKDGKGYVGWGEFNMTYWPPTHWLPIPMPPKVAG